MFSRPIVESWYKDTETLHLFEVIDVDKEKELIEIQYDNGDLGEYSFEDWKELALLPSHPPEDWALIWELSPEDRHQAYGEIETPCYLENIECSLVEESFESLSNSIDSNMQNSTNNF